MCESDSPSQERDGQPAAQDTETTATDDARGSERLATTFDALATEVPEQTALPDRRRDALADLCRRVASTLRRDDALGPVDALATEAVEAVGDLGDERDTGAATRRDGDAAARREAADVLFQLLTAVEETRTLR
ncbi:hypothetical protein RYH80_03560 [Halobaculum sp. MBLA0147]|uniref:hypothetical protein n=1 Tax=Halobaculum sp. MBLA0147 TaxID=3079934 RepID=UPI0035242CAD